MAQQNEPVYGNVTYNGDDGATYGGSEPTIDTAYGTPWRINAVRVEGLNASESIPPVVPGQEATYEATFLPVETVSGATLPTHTDRYNTVKGLFRYAPFVVTYQTASGDAYWREQHHGASPLVAIEPIPASAPAQYPDGSYPDPRDSIHEGRWAVVTGGEPVLESSPDAGVTLSIETVTIASLANYPTEDGVRNAFERSEL